MKNSILSIALLFSYYQFSIAQNYHTIPATNFIWSETENVMGSIHHREYFPDLNNPDTIINTNTYTKVFCDSLTGYVGAYRSDTTGKAYYVPIDSIQEYLLMDLSKNVGDSVRNIIFCYPFYDSQLIDLYVDSVDFVNAGPYTLKRLFLSNQSIWPNQYHDYSEVMWMEKIGTSNGFYNLINYYSMGAFDVVWLDCMYYNDTTYYIDNTGYIYNGGYFIEYSPGHCTINVGIDELSDTQGIIVYPNPCSDRFTIDNLIQNSILSVYDMQGQLLFKEITGGQKTDIDISGFVKGVYFLRLIDEKTNRVIKIIKE